MHQKVLSMILVLVMLLGLLSVSAFTVADTTSSDSATNSDDGFYRIVHLDCGRKYFSKDWIIALLNEMKADGYNQLQLAFGNDGLRFLLNDMSFTANGTTYSHQTVVSKVEAGNMAQNSSGDASWLSQSEMDEIIAVAKTLGIEIVPLLNLPGHANAILDIAEDAYNASGSNNTLDVANSEKARNFGMAIFQKYVDYFAGKGCKFFNFGADEYANDASGTFSFSRLNSTQYATFVNFINSLAAYVESKGMTPRAFNDGLYYNNQSANIDTNIQCCYWSSGWGSNGSGYPVASASTISGNGHAMINTHGDYYYVLGKNDNFDNGYSYASGFDNTVFAGNKKISNPVGSMFCIWCDYPNAESETVVAQNVRLTMRAMALRMNNQSIDGMDTSEVVNGFKANGKLNTGSTGGSETENVVDITVMVNGTFEKTVSGANYACDEGYTTADETVASVVVNGEDATKSEPIYDSVDVSYSTLAGNNSAWAKTNYYYKDGDEYCPVYAYKKTERILIWATTTYHYGYMPNGEAQVKEIDNATSGSSTVKVYEQTGVKEGTPASTTITFTGHKVGDTTVVIGGVTYKIHVTAEDLSKVTPLKLEYWITNAPITSVTGSQTVQRTKVLPDNQGNYNNYTVYFTNIMANASKEINSEAGIDVTTIAPANTSHDNRTVYYWRCRMLDMKLENTSTSKTQQQTADGGDDETVSGIGFTKIRYYGGSWQVFTENNAWVTVDTDKNQLIAYYLENIKVSDEVDSFAADWGNRGDGSKGGWLDTSSYCTLSMQVVYEDGTTNPTGTTANDLKSKTIVYGYWSQGRGIGTVLLNGQEYEIYKVTSETGAATASFSGYNATVTNFTWDKNETTVWEGDPSSSVSIHNNANGFSTEGANANLCWDENNEAILLRVYVKAKVTEDSLTVNYYDESNKTLPFYSYNIAVASGTTFSDDFAYVPGNPNESPNGSLINNTVENIKGVTQTVNWQLEKMSEIGAQYRFGNYTFTNATKETGNKVVNLYYRFKPEKTFVVDFGLPLHIEKTDINQLLATANITSMTVGNSLYATVKANSDYSIDYVLNKTIDGSDRVTVSYTGTKVNGESDSATYNLNIIPATTVYYEDSFATFNGGTGAASGAQWSIVGDNDTATTDQSAWKNQALTELGKMNADAVYGYDAAYADSTKLSMGSAHKVTVKSNMYVKGDTATTWPTATFTFKGTGFDVISLTSNTSGTVMYTVMNSSGETKKTGLVDTYYGYKLDGDKWVVDNDSNGSLYQIPVIKVSGLDYDEYTVTLSVRYGEFFDHQSKGEYSFWLDAIRVYDPMNKDNATYTQDGEGYPQYIKLHDALVSNNAQSEALFIDGGPQANVDTYKDYGPNNEVYLKNGQAITFNVPKNTSIASIQIGAKAPDGRAAKMVVNNGTPTDIASATEMYYKIAAAGQSFTITNTGTGILSLTNLKITFNTKPSGDVKLAALTTADQENAVAQVRALFVAPAEPFQPARFEASWGHAVRKGDTATLTVKTSEDVESITVDGQKITTYDTKTERTGWGWWAKTVTYRVFTYQVKAAETADYTVCAVNSDGVSSDPITAKLTVRPSVRDWWHGIFDKWF